MNKYHVTKNKVPCRLMDIGLHYKGVLVPVSQNEEYKDFGENRPAKQKAARAISRTIRVADKLRSSVISGWDRIAGVVSPGQFEIVKVNHKKQSTVAASYDENFAGLRGGYK